VLRRAVLGIFVRAVLGLVPVPRRRAGVADGRAGQLILARGGHRARCSKCSAQLDASQAPRYRSTRMAPLKSQANLESFPVGAAEIAERLGVRGQTVHTWRQRKLMPPPRWTVSGQPAWDWSEIEEWARRTGRLRTSDVHAGLAELEGMGWEGDLEVMRESRVTQR
jgi:hypothetical protein